MKLDLMEVILYVNDMDGQVDFYSNKLGLAVNYPPGLNSYADEYWVALNAGRCVLALHGGGTRQLGKDAPKIVFQVEDIAQARAELLTKGVILGDIREAAPGVSVVDGVDPEGNKFSLETHQ